MNDDELRRALDGYAAAAPYADPRPGLHARLARRRTMRGVAGIAAVAAFVAGTGAAVVLDRDRPVGVVVAADPSETPTPRTVPTTDPPESSPSPTTSPAATPTVQPFPPVSPSSAPPGTPAPTADRDRSPVSATAEGEHGLRVRITLDPRDPATGDGVRLTVDVSDDDGGVDGLSVDWGDGTGEAFTATAQCAAAPPLGQREPQPVRSRTTYSHSWRNPGDMRVKVSVSSRPQCQDAPPPEEATAVVVARVWPGDVSSNGPAPASVSDVTSQPGDGANEVAITGHVGDADGHVASAVVDWGDGTSDTVRNDSPCNDGDGRHYPYGTTLDVSRPHTYAKPGTYTVTVRVVSTGCGGKDPQRGSRSVAVSV